MRKFEIRYYEYDRHDHIPVKIFRKLGETVVEAFSKLPLDVRQDVLQIWDSDQPLSELDNIMSSDGVELNDTTLAEVLDGADSGGDSCVHVLEQTENGLVHVCGTDGGYAEEGCDQEW